MADTTRFVSHDLFPSQQDIPVQAGDRARSGPLPVQGQRLGWGVLMWAVLTVGALLMAWHWPDATLLHFWLVAQAVPVLYWLLMAWVIRSPSRGNHDA